MPENSLQLRKLLVAADFSPPAEAALHRAVSVARNFAAEITVCHVLHDVREAMAVMRREARWELVAGDIHKYEQALCEESETRLDELLHPLQDGSVTLRHETRVGATYIQLIHAVQDHEYELVFVGTRGVTGLKRLVLGSTAQRLLAIAGAGLGGQSRARLAVEDDPGDDRLFRRQRRSSEAGRGARLALGAELHLLHAVQTAGLLKSAQAQGYLEDVSSMQIDQEVQQHLQEFAALHCNETPVQLHVVHGQPAMAIVEAAAQLSADLTVLSTVGRSGLPGLLIGNTAEQVVDSLACDVLAVKPKAFISPILPALHVEAPICDK